MNTFNNDTTEQTHTQNGFRRDSAFDDSHPERTAKVRLALAAAKAKPGAWHSTHCLAHDDAHPSASVMFDKKGILAAKCYSQGCTLKEIRAAFEERGLLEKPRIVATYRYEYEDGSHAFDVVRFAPKAFKQRRADGQWSMKGVRLVPFKLRELLSAAADQWVLANEGEEGTLAARKLGFVATNSPGGAGKFKPEYAQHLAGRKVAWIADNDEPGERHVWLGARILHGIAAEQKIIRPPNIPPGGDIRDWLKAGGAAEQLRALIDSAPLVSEKDFELTEQQGGTSGPYEATPSGIVFHKLTPSAEKATTPLCNFVACIKADIENNDGVESSRHFEIELGVGGVTKTAVIPAKDYPSFNWLPEKFGSRPVIYAGNGVKDRVRDAVQRLSTDTISRTVRTHTGLVKINGTWRYLHGGGAIGNATDVDVELPSQLSAFDIPEATPGEIVAGIRSSLELLDLAPDHIMVPLYCSVLRAPLGQCDFGLHLDGLTGLLKSELVALMWQHYGRNFSSRGLPSWTSTPYFLQGLSFIDKDALLVIDDLLGADISFADRQRQYVSADLIFRGLGNNAARGRMRSDTTLRPTKPTRCLILSTGEEKPRGQSLLARIWSISLTAEDTGRDVMNFERLSRLQRAAALGEFAHAMRGYIEYFLPQYDAICESLRNRVSEYRDKAAREIGTCHARTPTMMADLFVGALTFFDFAVDRGAISTAQAEEYKVRFWSALVAGAKAQARSQASQEPARRFLELLMAAVSAGKAYLAPLNSPAVSEEGGHRNYPLPVSEEEASRRNLWRYGHSANGLRVGWFDGDDVYLEPDASYKAACEMSTNGSGLSIGPDTLRRQLKEKKLLASTDTKRQTIYVRKTAEGVRQDVLHLRASTLGVVTSDELDVAEFEEKH